MKHEEFSPGRSLGRYQLLVPIAMGGTASVWAARMKGPRGFEKIVAVKVMLSEFLDDPDAETMFLDEARLVSRIRHPNVAEVLDLGEEGDALFIVMEWVDGEPLHVIAREAKSHGGGVPLHIIVRTAKQICAGLHAAHELRDPKGKLVGLVHRDISPQNILVGYDGIVKLIDFGVAKATSNQLRTNVGQIKGKVAYMAPEQALGDPVDRRTDVFALGIVLYQLVTGKHPFRGDNEFATLGRLRDKRPMDPPRQYCPNLPVAVNDIIVKALSKDKERRFATVLDLGRTLENAFPLTKQDGDDADLLKQFMRSLLGERGERKRAAIREALENIDASRPTLSVVPLAFVESKTGDSEESRAIVTKLPHSVRDPALLGPIPKPAVPRVKPPIQPAPKSTEAFPRKAPPDRQAALPKPPAPPLPSKPTPPSKPSAAAPPKPLPFKPAPPKAAEPSPSNPGLNVSWVNTPVVAAPSSFDPGRNASLATPTSALTPNRPNPSAAAIPNRESIEIPNFRTPSSQLKWIAAAMAIFVVIAAVLWGASSSSTDSGTNSGDFKSKRPW